MTLNADSENITAVGGNFEEKLLLKTIVAILNIVLCNYKYIIIQVLITNLCSCKV